MLHSDGVVFFWHKRNGGGGWSEAAFCLGYELAMNRLRYEACGIADGAVGAKSVTEKDNPRACGRRVQQKDREARSNLFSQCAMPCKGDGFLMHEENGMDYKFEVNCC